MSIIDDVTYCFSRSQDEFASNNYNTGAYYQNEIVRMVDAALNSGIITTHEATSLKHFGRI